MTQKTAQGTEMTRNTESLKRPLNKTDHDKSTKGTKWFNPFVPGPKMQFR